MLDLIAIPLSLLFGYAAVKWLVSAYPALMTRPNFRGNVIPSSYGLLFVVAAGIYYGGKWAPLAAAPISAAEIYLIAVCGFGLLGLLDDLAGDRSVGGLKGHLTSLFLRQHVTTGAVKAIGGVAIALICGWMLTPNFGHMVLNAILIAGMANILNLVDLRPGRALTAFLVLALPVIFVCGMVGAHGHLASAALALFAVLAALLLLSGERSGRFMLGDTGANSLGAALGVSYALFLTDARVQIVAAVLIVVFHAWTERNSLNKLIESKPLLSRIDRKIGLR